MNAVARPLAERVRQALAVQRARAGVSDPPSGAEVAALVRSESRLLGDRAVLTATDAVHRELTGAGPLEPLLALPGVTDVLVHGPDQVWIDRGDGLEAVEFRFPDEQTVRRLAQRLAASAGRRLDDATPYADARLSNGVRFHAVLAPVSAGGTCISLRLPPRRTFTLEDLVAAGFVPAWGAQILADIVRARLAFLVTGGTGTGKTTLLNALLSLVPDRERIVSVEDAAELAPAHPHVVRLEARPPNLEGAGEITLRTLVRHALRMRPDRLVVGEVRGGEVVDLLAALNTGHEGGCGTLHANSAAEVPARVEALGVAAGLDRPAVHSQLRAAVDAVIHLVRGPDGRRRVAQICVLETGADGLVAATRALDLAAEPRSLRAAAGPGWARLEALLARGAGSELRTPCEPKGRADVSAQTSLATETRTTASAGLPSGDPTPREVRHPCEDRPAHRPAGPEAPSLCRPPRGPTVSREPHMIMKSVVPVEDRPCRKSGGPRER